MGGASSPIEIHLANALFGQTGYDFRESFLELVKEHYGAGLGRLDFAGDGGKAASERINRWVELQTKGRIANLLEDLDPQNRLILVNAIYFKGPWASEFPATATKPAPFHVDGGTPVNVPTMKLQSQYGYAKRDGYVALSIPYVGDELHFLILLPDDLKGLPALEARLTAEIVADCAELEAAEVEVWLPRFKLEPPTLDLKQFLQEIGMKAAFDQPPGSANFDRLAPRRADDYLFISEVSHKTFIAVDERGTEAAAATAVRMLAFGAPPEPPRPIVVRINRPFYYAIQHRPTGACLFMGRVVDPRPPSTH